MNRVIVFVGIVFFLFSCEQPKPEAKGLVEIKEGSVASSVDSSSTVQVDSIDNFEAVFVSTEATVLSIGEELIMPSDYLTTTMHVVTEEGDTLVFLNMSESDASIGERIALSYKMEKAEDALLCLDCKGYLGSAKLIDVTLIPGDIVFKSLKLIKCTPDDYLVLNANFQMEDAEGINLDFKTLDYKMIEDTTKMLEGFYSYGIVSQYYPKLVTFDELGD